MCRHSCCEAARLGHCDVLWVLVFVGSFWVTRNDRQMTVLLTKKEEQGRLGSALFRPRPCPLESVAQVCSLARAPSERTEICWHKGRTASHASRKRSSRFGTRWRPPNYPTVVVTPGHWLLGLRRPRSSAGFVQQTPSTPQRRRHEMPKSPCDRVGLSRTANRNPRHGELCGRFATATGRDAA